MITRRDLMKRTLAGVISAGINFPFLAGLTQRRIADMELFDRDRGGLSSSRGRFSWHVREVEGPVMDVGGARPEIGMPRPMLLRGSGGLFHRCPDHVLDFICDALHLKGYWDWERQRSAFRYLVQWFFSGEDTHAWISTNPFKPKSSCVCESLKAESISTLTDLCPGKPTRASFAFDLPDLPLRAFRFGYHREASRKDKEFFQAVHDRELIYADGHSDFGSDYSVYFSERNNDGWAHTTRYYDEKCKVYTCPHVFFWKIVSAAAPQWTVRLAIGLQPNDGQTLILQASQWPLRMFLSQLPVEMTMLKESGAF